MAGVAVEYNPVLNNRCIFVHFFERLASSLSDCCTPDIAISCSLDLSLRGLINNIVEFRVFWYHLTVLSLYSLAALHSAHAYN